MDSLAALSAQTLASDPAAQAIEFEGRWFHWGELRRIAEAVAHLADASGAPPGAPVAFVARNRPSAVTALLGLIAAQRSLHLIYAFQSPAGIARDVAAVGAPLVLAAAEDLSSTVVEAIHKIGAAAISLGDHDAASVPGLAVVRGAAFAAPGNLEIQLLTSGTTGPPKRFALGFDTIARHIVGANRNYAALDADPARLPPFLLYFPIGNISGIYGTLPTMLRGHRAVLLERFSVDGWLDHVKRYRPERASLPPAGVQMVLDAEVPIADLAPIRSIGTGAAPLDPGVQRAFEARYGIPILLSYGATEFGGPVAVMTPELHVEWGSRKFGSVGRAFAGCRLRIVDPATGKELPPGEEGLIEAIAPRIGPDWIRTSDLAVIDADSFLFHRGRADGAILRGGFKIMPEAIEQALLRHPAVSAAAVVGIADPRLGQIPAAAIQLRPGAVATRADLEAHLRGLLYTTHIPAAWRFGDLPRTPSLKVDRPGVQRLFGDQAQPQAPAPLRNA